jgi:hypothetical protein
VGRVSKAIASLGSGDHERLLKLASRSFRPFAERHGYALHLHTQPVDRTRPAPWSKIPIVRDLLDRYDTVLWLDSDTVVVDPREDLPATRFMGLVEHPGLMVNTGVWSLRSTDETRAFLDEVWAQEDLVEHRWWENAAVARLLDSDAGWRDRVDWLDQRWNVIPDAKVRHARIRHYPGYKLRTRAAFMTRDLLLRRR